MFQYFFPFNKHMFCPHGSQIPNPFFNLSGFFNIILLFTLSLTSLTI
ncbi:hypothetical protein ECAA86_03023 [Escherichia coli AA86]|nr:hypothetical protein ECAA86_03023 [Escherichia coli AA86]